MDPCQSSPYSYLRILTVIGVGLLWGCRSKSSDSSSRIVTLRDTVTLSYAKGFSIQHIGTSTELKISNPWQGATVNFTYVLASGKTHSQDHLLSSQSLFTVPIKSVISMTTTNLPDLEALGVLGSLVGMGGGRYVCNPSVRERLNTKKIIEVGGDGETDMEAIVGLNPDVVFTYAVGNSSDGNRAKLAEASIPTVIDGAYMEETPLGRAEWIKFRAAFFGKEALADSLFKAVENSYDSLLSLVKKSKSRPKVLVNAPFNGIWWMPGGRSYVAKFLQDAGAEYLWTSDTTKGSLNLDLEEVFSRAGQAEFWLNPGEWRSLKDGLKQDKRNAYFEAFKSGRVYNNDKILSEAGGNDFFESGASHPDWILADLISIFHPELVPGYKAHWYRKLELK